jgi:DNA-binding response OmpR family regulator
VSARRILLLGNLKGTAMAAVEGATRQIGSYLTHHSRADEAIRELDHREWRAVLVDITTPGASRFCHEARARRALFNVPLLGLTPQLTDLAFSNAFRWGADDVVPLGLSAPIVSRLAAPPGTPPTADPARGEAIVSDSDRGRCDVLGRVLANAGYSVRYAIDLVSARYYLSKKGVTLFVVNEELGDPPALIQEARAQGNEASWVVTAKQRNIEQTRNALQGMQQVAVMSSHGPPENVLFALDFLNPSQGAARRAQVRALHGTMVLFRGEGEEEDQCGYTYSVSGNGLYVRTLLPPPSGNLWVEVEPPKAARRVRLLGTVAWSRTFGQSGAETAPPGFGVKLKSGLGEDLKLWVSGFESLDGAKPDPHVVPEVKFTPQPFRVPLPATLSQAPRTSFVSRPSQPIIAVTGARPVATERPRENETAAPSALPSAPVHQPSERARETPASIARVLDALTPMPAPGEEPGEEPELAPEVTRAAPALPEPVSGAEPPPKPPPVEGALYQSVPDKVTTLDEFDPEAEHLAPRPSHSEASLTESFTNATLEPPHDASAARATREPPRPARAVATALEPLELDESARVPSQTAPAPSQRRRAWWVLAAIAFVASGIWAARGQRSDPTPARPEASDEPARIPTPKPMPCAQPDENETAPVEPSVSAPEALPTDSASPAPSSSTVARAPFAPDAGALPEDECWLRVESNVDAIVFVHGVDVGRTNRWLRSRCGFRFVRLGAAPGQWLSEGTPLRLPCRQAVKLRIRADQATDSKSTEPNSTHQSAEPN